MSILDMNKEQVEFYATIGFTITQWAHVEQSLFNIYWHSMGEIADASAAASFYAILNFNSKVAMTDAAMTVRYYEQPETLARWNNIQNRLLKRAKKRNELAHFQCLWDATTGGPITGSLVPHLFNPLQHPHITGKPPKPAYKTADIEIMRLRFAQCFVQLSNLFAALRGQPEIFQEPQIPD